MSFWSWRFKMVYDLIVVGGGPAGSTCARKAAQLGLDVVLIEKHHHPRRKACGGGLTTRVRRALDVDFSPVVEREQCGLRLFSPSGLTVEEVRAETTGYMVRREDFDHLLLREAERAGATVMEGVAVVDVVENANTVDVITDEKTYSGRLLVGADGVNSTVARRTGIKTRWRDDEICLCIEAAVPMDPEDIVRIVGDPNGSQRVLIEIYFGALRHGYAWAFGKRAEMSLGIGVLVSELEDLRGAWKRFVLSFEKRYDVRIDLSATTAARVPLKGPIDNTIASRVMLVGDAAGFVSPATGEGIYYAIESGKIAAEIARDIISEVGGVSTETYQQRWQKAFGKDLGVANFLAGMMFHSIENMEAVCRMAYDDPVMRAYTFELITGAVPYRTSRNRLVKRMLRKHLRTAIKMIL